MISQLANHLWHSTIFTCVVALLTLMLRRNRAALRHGLWLSASIKFLIPFSLLIGIGREIGWRNIPAIEQPRIEIVEQVSEPFATQSSSPLTHPAPKPANPLPAILFGVWLCGFAAHSLAWWRRWRRVRIALRAASPASLNLSTRAMFGPAQLEPGVFGIFNPVLLLPRGITERLTPAQFDAIIAHELCHVRRRDNLSAAIHMVVEALFWFHPLVWWIERRLVNEREQACDEEVLQMAIDPKDYAEGIVNVCRLYLEAPLACITGVTGGNLKRRVEAIMANRSASRLNFGRKLLLTAAGITAVAAPLTLGILTASRIHAQTRNATAATPTPKFEVASVKANKTAIREGCSGTNSGGQTYTSTNCPLAGSIMFAYDVTQEQISGLTTNALLAEKYDITAEAEHPVSLSEMKWMLQSLLQDRFKLSLRRETKETPVYALVVGKGGPKFRQSQAAADEGAKSATGNAGQILAQNVSMTNIVLLLSRRITDRIVVDKTGLKGTYDLDMTWTLELGKPDGPSIFTAIQELGLKLEPRKIPVELLVIDRVERPSEN